MRYLPLAVIVVVAAIGAFTLRDYLSFDALRDNREALIAFRDNNYLLTALAFVAAYVVLVAFSLPGATVATLTGGFLFGLFPGVLYNVGGATLGAIVIFLAAQWGLGDRLKERMDASDGVVRKIKAGIDDNQWSMLFFIRLVPVVPFFVANLVPAPRWQDLPIATPRIPWRAIVSFRHLHVFRHHGGGAGLYLSRGWARCSLCPR